MYKLVLLIWNKEQLHIDWMQGIICQINKKVTEQYVPAKDRSRYLTLHIRYLQFF